LVVKGGVADFIGGEIEAAADASVDAGVEEGAGGGLIKCDGIVHLLAAVGGGDAEILDGAVDERTEEGADGLALSVELLVDCGGRLS
jgi:hypothetical protein